MWENSESDANFFYAMKYNGSTLNMVFRVIYMLFYVTMVAFWMTILMNK